MQLKLCSFVYAGKSTQNQPSSPTQSPKTDDFERCQMVYPSKWKLATPVNIPTAHPNPQQSHILPRIPSALNTCPNPSHPQLSIPPIPSCSSVQLSVNHPRSLFHFWNPPQAFGSLLVPPSHDPISWMPPYWIEWPDRVTWKRKGKYLIKWFLTIYF